MWTCIDLDTKQKRAVKIVPDMKCLRKTWCPRFNKKVPDEVSLWLPLCHPNLVSLLEVFYDEENNYWMYVMDYERDYQDLFNYIDQHGPLTSAASSVITRQVVKAVHYLISCGVDHRDIKDENILLNPTTLQIKLIDFGSASKLSPTLEPYTTYQGTDVYLPPEYYREKKYSAFPAAVWTIGCLVHCLIAGDCPFNDKTEVMGYVRLQWLDDGDDLAKEFINQCMQSEADQRLNVVSLLKHRWFNEPEVNPTLSQ